MRFADLLGLALSALWQQKVRSLLTTLGVLFGSLVLIVTMSARLGVEETIVREYRRFGDLRKINVHAGFKKGDTTPKAPEVPGTMSEDRRARLAREITRRSGEAHGHFVFLTSERLRALERLEHVQAVDPMIGDHGRVFLGERGEHVQTTGAPPDGAGVRDRLLAGEYFDASQGRGVLVTEYLLYRLGVIDEADVPGALGKPIRLELQKSTHASPSLLLSLLDGRADKTTAAEEKVLQQILERFPEVVGKLDLPPEQQAAAVELFRRLPGQRQTGASIHAEDFTIRGILRSPEQSAFERSPGWLYAGADLILPAATAEELYFRLPRNREQGLGHVLIEVDEIEHVKGVVEQIEQMGLRTNSLVIGIEREQFVYRLVFTSMTVIALVALMVACLGITNTMLMSVLERVREIGIMKAVGAREGHIQMIFLVEGALGGLVGGLLGLLLGWAGSFPGDAWVRAQVNRQMQLQLEESIFRFPWWLVLGVPLFTCLVTTLAAVLPARRAARVNPIVALRHE